MQNPQPVYVATVHLQDHVDLCRLSAARDEAFCSISNAKCEVWVIAQQDTYAHNETFG